MSQTDGTSNETHTVAVIGLGKLGACLAACLAHKDFRVIGVDRSKPVLDALRVSRSPVVEPGLQEMLSTVKTRLEVTEDTASAVRRSEVSFVVVPTPSRADGTFSTDYAVAAAEAIGPGLASRTDYHVVVLVSTVLPGDIEAHFIPALERVAGRRVGRDFGVCYSPEFIALGNVLNGILRPELQLIGESDDRAGRKLAEVYEQLNDNHPVVVRTNFVNAELAKISLNAYITLKITFANLLADICERLPGADVDLVTKAIGSDSRIGTRYLRGGLGYAGPCFPRDDIAFGAVARQAGAILDLATDAHAYNASIPDRIVARVNSVLPAGGTVAVIGLAYKPDTPVIDESQGVEISRQLAEAGVPVIVFDPLASEAVRARFGDQFRYASSLREALDGADVAVLANPLPELKRLDLTDRRRPLVVIDCWRVAEHVRRNALVNYIAVGRGAVSKSAQAVERPPTAPVRAG
jgi:UDPglucose 6-dehydrogenase